MEFDDKLRHAWSTAGTPLCVGLDPIVERMPEAFRRQPRPILAFNRFIIDLVGERVAAFKPQCAHHAAVGAEADLAETIAYIRDRAPHAVVILDAKRGDIGSTAQMYAREAFERYDADAVTVNPYMGDDTVVPFLEWPGRAAVVLCRTSNPDADRFQTANADGEPLYLAVARRAEHQWSRQGAVMLVVGATAAKELAAVRVMAPNLAILVPGFGEQGGSGEAVIQAGRRTDGQGLVVSSSRKILYAGGESQIRRAVEDARTSLASTVDA